MSKNREWLWPWEKDPNWIQDPADNHNRTKDPDDPEHPVPGRDADQKTSAKKQPQYTIESAEIVIPEEGIKEHQSYNVKGNVKPVDGVRITSATISVYIFQRYKNIEAVDGQPVKGTINQETNTFEVIINGYLNPDNFDDDTGRPPDSTFEHLAEIRGPAAGNTKFRSPAIKLPMATKNYTLKRGCYDKTWSDPKKGTAEYPESGDNYFPNDAVKKVQTLLIKPGFLTTGNDTGFYGSLTEAAVHDFQVTSKGRKRSKVKDGRIFFIPVNEVSFKGADDGIYGPETEKELAHWNSNNWIKPKIHAKKDDVDDNGVQNGHGERGADNYHEGNQILDYQKLLQAIGAYKGKLDGWLGPKTESAIEWLHECIAKCNFLDASGNKVELDVKGQAQGHREKHADEASKKAAEKVKEKGAKVPPKTGATKTSESGKQFIMLKEGFVATPYNDSAGHATIGYGTLLHKGGVTDDDKIKYSKGITKEEGRTLLDSSIIEFEKALNKAVKVPLNQNQFDALMSWTYNFGPDAIAGSTWCKELNAGHYDLIPDELKKWHHITVNGKQEDSPGLITRRNDESELFQKK